MGYRLEVELVVSLMSDGVGCAAWTLISRKIFGTSGECEYRHGRHLALP